MEASTAAPAAADAAQTQAPAEQQAPLDPTQAQPPAPDQPVQPEADSPEAKLAAAEQRAREAEEQLAALQGEPQDLLSALGPDDLALDSEEVAAYANGEDPNQGQQNDQQVQEFEDWIKEQVRAEITPMEEARRDEQISAWHKDHPDLKPPPEGQKGDALWNSFMATMQKLGAEHGEGATKSLSLIDLAYTAAKAKLADDGAVPAEQAATHGASIETQAGQTQAGQPSEEDEYRQKVFGAQNSRDGAAFR